MCACVSVYGCVCACVCMCVCVCGGGGGGTRYFMLVDPNLASQFSIIALFEQHNSIPEWDEIEDG